MTSPTEERIEALIEKALSEPETARAPVGFAERTARQLEYAEMYRRQWHHLLAGAAAGVAGICVLVVVGALFWYAVDLPGIAVKHIPGILGRIDGLQIAVAQAAPAIGALAGAALGVSIALAFAANRLRRRLYES